MIRKMTKYSFLLLSGETDSFLSSLQSIGLIDISRSQKPADADAMALFNKSEELRMLIERIEKDDFSRCQEHSEIKEKLERDLEQESISKIWGDFDPISLLNLENYGLKVRFYSLPKKRFNPSWEKDYALTIISEDSATINFVVTATLTDLSFPVKECERPTLSLSAASAAVKEDREALSQLEARLKEEKNLIPELKAQRAECINKLEKKFAHDARSTASEGALDIFVGFALTDDDQKVKNELDKLGVFYIAEAATKEDNPPIQLKNNWFARNFETLTGMYGMPVYDEFDPTPVLAPFYLLFWSFCMGDAGYGLLLMLVALMLRKVDFLGLKNHWRLVMTLGVGTSVIGVILATFFGINMVEAAWVPDFLKKIMISGKVNAAGMSFDAAMVASLAVGVFHLCLAMIVKGICYTQRFGFKGAVSTWGWVTLIVGGLIIAGLSLTSIINSEITRIAIIIIGVISALGIFVFNTPGRNPLMNVGAGLWDTYNMSTGLLGDLLSYTRLYALGLAGGMLGGAFNDLGMMILGSNPTWQFLPFALVVLFGHVLNFAMACLGAFVHPLRLTFVEYFKNSGYEGKGTKYNPLKEETI